MQMCVSWDVVCYDRKMHLHEPCCAELRLMCAVLGWNWVWLSAGLYEIMLQCYYYYSDLIRASWHLKALAIHMFFFQQIIQVNCKENIKALYYWPYVRGTTSGQWIPINSSPPNAAYMRRWAGSALPGWRQAIIWTNADILSIRPQGTYFNEILLEIQIFSFRKMHLKMSSAKWRPFCPGGDESKRDSNAKIISMTLTHWGQVTHVCISEIIIIASDNGLSRGLHQAIIWTNAVILLIGPLGTNFNEILLEIHIPVFSFTKIHWKMSSGKWRSFCLGLNVLISLLWEKKIAEFFCSHVTEVSLMEQ